MRFPFASRLGGSAALLALAGCNLAPRYHVPSTFMPTGFKEAPDWRTAAPADAVAKGQWWLLFNDPVLTDLESRVAVDNQNVAASAAAYDQARAAVREVRAQLFPSIDLSGSATRAGSFGNGTTTIIGGTVTNTGSTGTTGSRTGTTGSTGAAGSGDAFSVTLSGVASAVKSVEGLVGSSSGTASQVASAILDVLSFGQIGSTVGAQNTALNAKHVESLSKVLDLITQIKGLVQQAAQGYADADQATAQGFGGDTSGSTTGSTTTPTTPTTLAATTDPQPPTTDAQTPAADTSGPNHNGLPDYVSPNPHPAVVGHDKQGHSLYDMTGQEAPTTRPDGTLDSWITDAKSALQSNGVDTSSMSDSDLHALIQHESSGNPNALNNWDSNAAKGIPSKGLMQTIDPTFNDYALPGHTDIWNPTDNIIAGVRYGIDKYGSFSQIPGVRALHRGGSYVGY